MWPPRHHRYPRTAWGGEVGLQAQGAFVKDGRVLLFRCDAHHDGDLHKAQYAQYKSQRPPERRAALVVHEWITSSHARPEEYLEAALRETR